MANGSAEQSYIALLATFGNRALPDRGKEVCRREQEALTSGAVSDGLSIDRSNIEETFLS
jgi:hypothetical protein